MGIGWQADSAGKRTVRGHGLVASVGQLASLCSLKAQLLSTL